LLSGAVFALVHSPLTALGAFKGTRARGAVFRARGAAPGPWVRRRTPGAVFRA
jgi:hypothetical protein